MAVQKDTGSSSSAPATNRHQASRTGTSSRTSTGSSGASSSGRSKSPGRPSRTAAALSDSGRASGGTAPPRPSPHPSRSAAATPGPPPYRYLVLPGNESVLLREALARRPWWEPVPTSPPGNPKGKAAGSDVATAAAVQPPPQQQCWNLWAGLNGQRFSQYELLTPPAGGGGRDTDPPSRRLVNRLPEHRLICTKSGLAGVLAAIKAGAATAAGATTTAAAAAATVISTAPETPGAAAAVAESRSGSRSGSELDLSWIPETYVVPAGPKVAAAGGGGGGGLSAFKAAFARHAAAGRRVWIAKPTCLNRGNGIEVYDSMERILEHLKGRPAGSSLILQKYIERPMLLGGRKFDIRAYVLVGPDHDSVWFHKEAYCRTSSTPYDASDLANRSAHLTNDAVQKHLDTYHAFEDHCKMSLLELGPALKRAELAAEAHARSAAAADAGGAGAAASSLPSSPCPSLDTRPGLESGLWGAMRRCVAALFSVASPAALNPRRLGHCFELLGLDFMMDAEGGLYLIEVNTSPALFRAGAYLSDLLPRLVEEVVQKVVDPLFPQPHQQPPASPSPPQLQPQQPPASPSSWTAGSGPPPPETAAAAAGVGVSGEGAALPLLDGFVRVELDEQLAAAAAAGKAGKAGRVSSLGSLGHRAAEATAATAAATAAAAAVGCKGAVAPQGGRRPAAAVATVAVGGGVRAARPPAPR